MSSIFPSDKNQDDALEHFDLTATRRGSLLLPFSLSPADSAVDVKCPRSNGEGTYISESGVTAEDPLTASTPQQSTAPWVSTPETLSQQPLHRSGTKRLLPGHGDSIELFWGEEDGADEEEGAEVTGGNEKEGIRGESAAIRSEGPAPPTAVKPVKQGTGPMTPSSAFASRPSMGSPARVRRRLSMQDMGRPSSSSLATRADSVAETIAQAVPSPMPLFRRDVAAEPATESRLPLLARPGYTMPSPRTPLWSALEDEEGGDAQEERARRTSDAGPQQGNVGVEEAGRTMNADLWAEQTRSFFELIDKRPLIIATEGTSN